MTCTITSEINEKQYAVPGSAHDRKLLGHGRTRAGLLRRQKPCTRSRSVFVRVLPCPEMFCDPFFMNKAGYRSLRFILSTVWISRRSRALEQGRSQAVKLSRNRQY